VKSHFFRVVSTISAGDRFTYTRLLTADIIWVHYICTSDKMAIPEMVPSSISHEEKIQKFCVRGRCENYCHLVLWRSDYYEWDVELGESQFRRL